MTTYDIPLLIKVAEMYYYKNISQKDISKLLNISRAKVSRILQEALSSGIVNIKITDGSIDNSELSEKLRRKYNLDIVRIINMQDADEGWRLKKGLGQEAKNLFLNVVEPNNVVGIGPGVTLREMISSFSIGEIPFPISVVPMMGGWSSSRLNYETNNLVYEMANTLVSEYYTLLVPAVVSNKEIRELMYSEPEIKVIRQLWENIDIAIYSIGPKLSLGEHKDLYTSIDSDKTTGDLLGWPIESDGTLSESELNNRLMSIPLEQLNKIPKRIAIGGGINKCTNVNAVLNGGYATHLITDYSTAQYILSNGG